MDSRHSVPVHHLHWGPVALKQKHENHQTESQLVFLLSEPKVLWIKPLRARRAP